MNRSFSQRSLAGFFRLSRAALVTPLRDGMNLVAKEYVAAPMTLACSFSRLSLVPSAPSSGCRPIGMSRRQQLNDNLIRHEDAQALRCLFSNHVGAEMIYE